MTVHERFMTHMKPSAAKQKSGYKLYMALDKYGREKFYVETLETEIPVELLDQKEIEYIARYNSYNYGYNSTKGGDGRVINLIDNEEELLEKAKQKVPAVELAQLFDVNVATIYRTLHKLGFYYYEIDEESVIRDALLGMRQEEIANKYGVNKVTIQRILRKNNIRFHRERIDMRDAFDVDAVRSDYEKQMPISEICKKYNLTKTTFYRIKKQYIFPTREQVYTNVTQTCDVEAIKADYFGGMKTKDIQHKYGLSSGSLYRIIKENQWKR
jgi:transposase